MVMKVLVILLAILQGGLTNQNNLQRTVKPLEGIEFEVKLSNDTSILRRFTTDSIIL